MFQGVVQRIENWTLFGRLMGVLVVASKSDTASMTLYNAMMRLDGWGESFSSSLGDYYIPVSYTHLTLPTILLV